MTESQDRAYKKCVSAALAAEVLSIPLAFVLPVDWSFENGLIENAQVVVLILAAIFILSVRSRVPWLQRFLAAGLILMALRELSWGRVFFPIGMEEFGAIFVPMTDYEYRVPVYIFLTAYGAAMLFVLIRFVPVRKILLSRQPWSVFAVMSVALIFNYIGDHGWLLGKGNGQILEELNELIFYLMTPVVARFWLCQQKNPST